MDIKEKIKEFLRSSPDNFEQAIQEFSQYAIDNNINGDILIELIEDLSSAIDDAKTVEELIKRIENW